MNADYQGANNQRQAQAASRNRRSNAGRELYSYRKNILKVAAEMLKEKEADLYCENAHVISRKTGKKVPFPNTIQRSLYDQSQIQGEAIRAFEQDRNRSSKIGCDSHTDTK